MHYIWGDRRGIEKDTSSRTRRIEKRIEKDRYYLSRRIDYGIGKDRYYRSLLISAEIEKDRVLGMQSYGLGEIEMFYLFQSPSSYLFEYFYFQQGYKTSLLFNILILLSFSFLLFLSQPIPLCLTHSIAYFLCRLS